MQKVQIGVIVLYQEYEPKTYHGIHLLIEGEDFSDIKVFNNNNWNKDWDNACNFIEETFNEETCSVVFDDSWSNYEADSQISSPRYTRKEWKNVGRIQ